MCELHPIPHLAATGAASRVLSRAIQVRGRGETRPDAAPRRVRFFSIPAGVRVSSFRSATRAPTCWAFHCLAFVGACCCVASGAIASLVSAKDPKMERRECAKQTNGLRQVTQ